MRQGQEKLAVAQGLLTREGMDMPAFTNRIASRIALRGAVPKLLLGFGAMALLLFGVTLVMRNMNEPAAPRAIVAPQTNAAVATQTTATPTTAAPTPRAFPKPTAKAAASESGTSPVQALVIGIALLGGLVGALFLAAKFMRKARMLPASRKQQLKLQDVLSLGPKKALYVVAFEGRTLLIASGGEGVNLIADYTVDELGSAPEAVQTVQTAPVAAAVAERIASAPVPDAEAVVTAQAAVRVTRAAGRPERVPAAFRHLLEREQSVELEA